MYVGKFYRKNLRWHVEVLDKRWSELLLSNEVRPIASKSFLFRFRAVHWMRNQIIKDLVIRHELEIPNG